MGQQDKKRNYLMSESERTEIEKELGSEFVENSREKDPSKCITIH